MCVLLGGVGGWVGQGTRTNYNYGDIWINGCHLMLHLSKLANGARGKQCAASLTAARPAHL